MAAFYFFVSILHINSDNLPQWVPAIIDSGIGISFALQSIPADSMKRLCQYSQSLVTSTCGATQINIHQLTESLLPQVQPIRNSGSIELRSGIPIS